ncbi:MAG: hypothetical protein ACM3XZ_03310 [Betaproteobacteria bacterium]
MKALPAWFVSAVVLIATWVTAGASPAVALEPGPLRAATYELSIRPEFDTPDVLVINSATLTNPGDVPYQGRVGFRVPKGARLQMVCEVGPGGGHACQPFRSDDREDYVEVWWNATRPIARGERFPIYVEYYYNPIASRNPKRFTHRFFPVYPMDSLYVVVTQPKGSSNFRLEPQASLSRPVQDGTVEWQYSFTDLPAQPLEFKVTYDKPNDTPSVPQAQNAGQGPPAGSAAPGGPAPWVKPLVVVLLGGVAAAFILILNSPRARQ